MNSRKQKCPICGNYTFDEDEGLGDICPACFCELGHDDANNPEDIEQKKRIIKGLVRVKKTWLLL